MAKRDRNGIDDTFVEDSLSASMVIIEDTMHTGEGSFPSFTSVNEWPEQSTIADRYEILGLLGTGGMGSVYRVRDCKLDEVVALKVLHTSTAAEGRMRERFVAEVRLARRVTHHNVVRTFDLGEVNERPFITMEWIQGVSLAAALKEKGAFPVDKLLSIGIQVCKGLDAAHRVDVIHRDLKPDNILLADDGRVVLTDFGIAHLTRTQMDTQSTKGLIGTPAYISPEQALGDKQVTPAVDVYALGAVLFEMATGVKAWPGDELFAVVNARLFQDPPDPRQICSTLPDDVAAIILQCLARDPAERCPSASAVKDALVACSQQERSHATPSFSETASFGSVLPTPVQPSSFSLTPKIGFEKSLAVLPFRNAGLSEEEHMVEGFVEDLIDTLSMTPHLKVRPWGMVASVSLSGKDLSELADELNVQVLVTGTLRHAKGSIQLRVRMFSAQEGFQLWAQKYQRESGDLLALSDEVAAEIASKLSLSPVEEKREGHQSPEMLDLYLRGRQEMRDNWFNDLTGAIELFQRALTIAPGDPMVLSGLAIAQARRSYATEFVLVNNLSRQLAEQAIALAPHRAEPHCALGFACFTEGKMGEAAQAVEQAIERVPTYAEAHDLLGRIHSEVGSLDKAVHHLETALLLAPVAMHTQRDLARCYLFQGRVKDAEYLLTSVDFSHFDERSRSIQAAEWARFAVWFDRIDWLKLEATVEPFASAHAATAILLNTRQFSPAFGDIVRNTMDSPRSTRGKLVLFQILAECYAFAGSFDESLDAIEEAVASGLWDLMWLEHCPIFSDEIRSLPRFEAVLQSVRTRVRAHFPRFTS
jgi:serine/threonine-protein kinase